ncbi:MAG: adenylosuccinate lyase, partial [Clostridia bacterium]|nr:adenylosuccinate lyase [Clostridia bacterium]
MTNQYESPLSSRYASKYMLELFSSDMRYRTWRRLWVSLAKAEMKLGLPVTAEQVSDLENNIENIDYE